MRPIWTTLLMGLFLALAPAAFASTTWYVNGTTGSDNNDCKSPTTACKTIGHAISLASPGDTIGIGPATYLENLTISISLKVIGSGAATTIIDGEQAGSVVFIPNTTGPVSLSKMTIQNADYSKGGGVYNAATLTISNSTVSGNIAGYKLGSPEGGGIFNTGALTINNSTISGNSATTSGGGIFSLSGTLTTINSSTISGNYAVYGGGISTDGTVTLQNTIVANSTSGGNCSGIVTSNGYNLSSDVTCNFNGPGDLNNTDPNLGALQNNGGLKQTQALLPGSPAIDAGNPSGCTDSKGNLLKTDQRGAPRPDKEDTGGCDMGAYERQSD